MQSTFEIQILLSQNDFTVARHLKTKEAAYTDSLFFYELTVLTSLILRVWPL